MSTRHMSDCHRTPCRRRRSSTNRSSDRRSSGRTPNRARRSLRHTIRPGRSRRCWGKPCRRRRSSAGRCRASGRPRRRGSCRPGRHRTPPGTTGRRRRRGRSCRNGSDPWPSRRIRRRTPPALAPNSRSRRFGRSASHHTGFRNGHNSPSPCERRCSSRRKLPARGRRSWAHQAGPYPAGPCPATHRRSRRRRRSASSMHHGEG